MRTKNGRVKKRSLIMVLHKENGVGNGDGVVQDDGAGDGNLAGDDHRFGL